jgi:hypothetical protein
MRESGMLVGDVRDGGYDVFESHQDPEFSKL